MHIKSVDFISSSIKKSQFPKPLYPEYAVVGRSNVGKSSLINFLSGRKGIAKISSFPGKTHLINHFLINKVWYIADFPGYGYNKVGKKYNRLFIKYIYDYLIYRKNIVCIFILIDSNLSPQKLDLNFLENIILMNKPFCLIFTKIDKLSRKKYEKNMSRHIENIFNLFKTIPVYFKFSRKYIPNNKILNFIEKKNTTYFGLKNL